MHCAICIDRRVLSLPMPTTCDALVRYPWAWSLAGPVPAGRCVQQEEHYVSVGQSATPLDNGCVTVPHSSTHWYISDMSVYVRISVLPLRCGCGCVRDTTTNTAISRAVAGEITYAALCIPMCVRRIFGHVRHGPIWDRTSL